MSTRRIFGYIGFVISLPIAYYYASHQNALAIGMIGLDTLIISLLIIIAVTTILYVIGRLIEGR